MKSTITDQIDQIEKPTCSVATDQMRLRRAMSLLPASQAIVSSGSQSVRWCERLGRVRRDGAGAVVWGLSSTAVTGSLLCWQRSGASSGTTLTTPCFRRGLAS